MSLFSVDRKLLRRRYRQRSGYVLIMTLVMIVVAALSLAGLTRRSLLLANEAISAQRQLQRHWSANSCRRLLLENADSIFGNLEELHFDDGLLAPAPRQLVVEISLGGLRHNLILSDENSKVNLNSLNKKFGSQKRKVVNQLVSNSSLLKTTPNQAQGSNERQYLSWGQVVDIREIGNEQYFGEFMKLAAQLTCWGNGKLNIHRVSDQTLLVICSQLVKQRVGQKLVEARSQSDGGELSRLLDGLGLPKSDRSTLKSWLTAESDCFSLWLEIDDGRRNWHHQWITGDASLLTADSYTSFSW